MHVWKPEDLQGLVLSYRGNLGCELRLVDLSLSATELTLCNLYGTMTIRIERTANITKTLLYFALAPPIRLTERTGILTHKASPPRQTLLGQSQWTATCSRRETFSIAGSEICLNDSHIHFLQLLAHCHLLEVSKTASCCLSLMNNNLCKICFSCCHCLIYVKYAYLWWSWICLMHAVPFQLKQYSCQTRQQHVRMCTIAMFS